MAEEPHEHTHSHVSFSAKVNDERGAVAIFNDFGISQTTPRPGCIADASWLSNCTFLLVYVLGRGPKWTKTPVSCLVVYFINLKKNVSRKKICHNE